jgi:MSHA pilin protein MshA
MLQKQTAFTLIELVVVILLLGILSVFVKSIYIDIQKNARITAVKSLAANVHAAMNAVHYQGIVTRNLGAGVGTVPVRMNGVDIRVWNGWPDRWWDGIGISLVGATPTTYGPSYLSTAPYPFQIFTFYGYGNSVLPGGLAGWVVTNAPNPSACCVTYGVDGAVATPPIVTYTSGC